jgi:hypothetical protein
VGSDCIKTTSTRFWQTVAHFSGHFQNFERRGASRAYCHGTLPGHRPIEAPRWRQEIAATGFSVAGKMANNRHRGLGAPLLCRFALVRRTKRFGQRQAIQMFQFSKPESVYEAVANPTNQAPGRDSPNNLRQLKIGPQDHKSLQLRVCGLGLL